MFKSLRKFRDCTRSEIINKIVFFDNYLGENIMFDKITSCSNSIEITYLLCQDYPFIKVSSSVSILLGTRGGGGAVYNPY